MKTYAAWRYRLCGLVMVAGLIGASGLARAATSADPEYRIGPGDVLTISVWKNTDLTQQVTVRPDGMISYPLVGQLKVAGLTPPQVKHEFATRIAEYVDVKAREISVIVDQVNSLAVSVLGEVNHPGRFKFHSRARILDALARAGGLTQYASPARIVILRLVHGHTERIPFNYARIQDGGPQASMKIHAGDVIYVP